MSEWREPHKLHSLAAFALPSRAQVTRLEEALRESATHLVAMAELQVRRGVGRGGAQALHLVVRSRGGGGQAFPALPPANMRRLCCPAQAALERVTRDKLAALESRDALAAQAEALSRELAALRSHVPAVADGAAAGPGWDGTRLAHTPPLLLFLLRHAQALATARTRGCRARTRTRGAPSARWSARSTSCSPRWRSSGTGSLSSSCCSTSRH